MKPGSLLQGVDEAAANLAALGDLGIDFDAITAQLQVDGVASFADAYEAVLDAIAAQQAGSES